MKTYINYTVLVLVLFSSFVIKAQNEKDIQAKIIIDQKDNLVSIKATAINLSSLHKEKYTYNATSLKRNKQGNLAKNVQSGGFSLIPNETKTLCQQNFNIDPSSYIEVYLFIKKDGKVIARESVTIGDIDKKLSISPIEETELEISGIVVDNVLTKVGKDFYEYFGIVNRLNGVNYPYIITINEKPSFGGRNSEISIQIKNDIIYTFRSLPKEEYLYAAAKEAHKRIFQYYSQKKRLLSSEFQY